MITEQDLLHQINGLKRLIDTDSEMIRIASAGVYSNKKVLSILKGQLIEMRDKALYSNGISFKESLIDVYDPDSPNIIYPSILEYRNKYCQEFEDRINGIKPRIGKVYIKRTVKISANCYLLHAKISSATTKTVLDTYYNLPVINVAHNCSNERISRLANILDTEIIGNLPNIAKLEIPSTDIKSARYCLSVHNNCSCIIFNGGSFWHHCHKLFVFESTGVYIYSMFNDIWKLQEICNREDLYTTLITHRNHGVFNSFKEIKEYK